MSKRKREQKQKQKQKRDRKQAAQRSARLSKEANPRIGYVAHKGTSVICDGDACVVVGTRAKMRDVLEGMHATGQTVEPAMFLQIASGLRLGAAYCFDEEAYGRFLTPGRAQGMTLTDEDFSEPGPTGLHFVRIQFRR